jgi:hypothetical protein
VISWIVATNNPEVLEANLLASLPANDDDEVILVQDPESITLAYAYGQEQATRPVRCYVHSDVEILDPARLRFELTQAATPERGMVGLVGSVEVRMPWWDGHCLGSVIDARMGTLDFGAGGNCSIVDGLLLATVQTVEWDTDWPGFHGYDHDSCMQMLRRGLVNWCLTGGHELVRHNTTTTSRMSELGGWDEAMARYREKWGSDG